MRAITKRCAKLLVEAGPLVDHGDLLYDERGLPKQTGAVSKPNLNEVWPVHPTAVWPEGLSLRREDMYEDREMYEYNTSTPGEARIHLSECRNAKPADWWDRDEPSWLARSPIRSR